MNTVDSVARTQLRAFLRVLLLAVKKKRHLLYKTKSSASLNSLIYRVYVEDYCTFREMIKTIASE